MMQPTPPGNHSASMLTKRGKRISGWTQQTVEEVSRVGQWGGPSLRYRGAEIECRADGRVSVFFLDRHPMDAVAVDLAVDDVVALIDVWLDIGELPY